MRPLPPQSVLLDLLSYDPETGLLTWRERPRKYFRSELDWKRWNGHYAGTKAFTADCQGYRHGCIFGQQQRAHRVIWKLVTGEDPPADIDHEDGNRSNNRIANLFPRTRSENCKNQKVRSTNSSGVMGVHWDSRNKKWRAQIHIGSFDTLEAAAAARRQAERALGFHPNHGRAA